MRILIAGDWHSELHEEAVFKALYQLGQQVFRFSWHDYFSARHEWFPAVDSLLKRIQNKYLFGPLLSQINNDLVKRFLEVKPDLIFVYRGTHITASTLREIKRRAPGVALVGYNNDDPFSPLHSRHLWRHFLAAIPYYDLLFAYRHANLEEFRRAGAKRVDLLRSWYIPERNFPIELSREERLQYGCDVMFAGHYEPDGRLQMLEDIVRRGNRLRLYGPSKYWNPVLRRSKVLAPIRPVRQVWNQEYNKAIAGAKLALCFLSKLNRDTYTRRCFEIPATGTMMLTEYSADLASLFREGEEVAFFRSPQELCEKVDFYLKDDDLRSRIAEGGHRRVHADGHDVKSRMRAMMRKVVEVGIARAA